jgi:hypothetical protein
MLPSLPFFYTTVKCSDKEGFLFRPGVERAPYMGREALQFSLNCHKGAELALNLKFGAD